MHDMFVVGVPLAAILAGSLFNRSDVRELRLELRAVMKDLRGEINGLRGEAKDIGSDIATKHLEVMNRFSQIGADLRQFYHLTGKLEARMDAFDKGA